MQQITQRRFLVQLAVAFGSYLAALPLTYLFISTVYGFGPKLAAWCVAIATAVTLPAMLIQARRTYRRLLTNPQGNLPLPILSRWTLVLLAIGIVLSAGGGAVIARKQMVPGLAILFLGVAAVVIAARKLSIGAGGGSAA